MVECKKYSSESYDWLNMLFSKEWQEVIITTKLLIHNCLKCDYNNICKDKDKLIKFLSSNDELNDWK
jgi:hypothetical protein